MTKTTTTALVTEIDVKPTKVEVNLQKIRHSTLRTGQIVWAHRVRKGSIGLSTDDKRPAKGTAPEYWLRIDCTDYNPDDHPDILAGFRRLDVLAVEHHHSSPTQTSSAV